MERALSDKDLWGDEPYRHSTGDCLEYEPVAGCLSDEMGIYREDASDECPRRNGRGKAYL